MRTIENTRDSDICIQVGMVDIIVPAASLKYDGESAVKVNGYASIADAELKLAMGSPVIEFYFSNGFLIDVTKEDMPKSKAAKKLEDE